jgi:hypothetical protein
MNSALTKITNTSGLWGNIGKDTAARDRQKTALTVDENCEARHG